MSMTRKSKTTAIVLAILLSFWTWCYTYKNDKVKFWVALPVSVLLCWTFIVPIGIWIWAIIDSTNTVNKDEYLWE